MDREDDFTAVWDDSDLSMGATVSVPDSYDLALD